MARKLLNSTLQGILILLGVCSLIFGVFLFFEADLVRAFLVGCLLQVFAFNKRFSRFSEKPWADIHQAVFDRNLLMQVNDPLLI
jgi:uncharacterized membrane protein HdeD (DUF308 family)